MTSLSSSKKKWRLLSVVQIGKHDPQMVGVVKRRARDGSWVDVWWLQSRADGDSSWVKRHYDPTKLRRASGRQRSLLAIWLALQEAVEMGYLQRVSA